MSGSEAGGEEFGEVEVIGDGEGLVFVGDPEQVAKFVASVGLPSTSFDVSKLAPAAAVGGAVPNAASSVSANAGRWMKLTEESARAARVLPLVKNSTTQFEPSQVLCRIFSS